MSNVAYQALKKLFDQGDKVVQTSRTTSLRFNQNRFPAYDKIKNAETRKDVHSILSNAEHHQAITIDWKKFFEGTEVERIRLKNIDLLADFLQVDTLVSRVNVASEALCAQQEKIPHWLNEVYKRVIEGWMDGKKPFRLEPEDTRTMHHIGLLISYLEKNENDLDMRTVSVRLFEDTKYIENKLLSKLIAIYKEKLSMSDASDEEVLAEISLAKYPWPVLVSGSIRITAQEGDAISCDIKPFIGIPPDSIKHVHTTDAIKYILSIENFSSFNTYTRKIHDGGIIIYTNGFPSKWLAAFYQKLLSEINGNIPVYHWGDMDVGGFRILAKMQEYANKYQFTVLPHQMSPNFSHKGKQFTQPELISLMKIAETNKDVSDLIQKIQSTNTVKVEQESLDPISPRASNFKNHS